MWLGYTRYLLSSPGCFAGDRCSSSPDTLLQNVVLLLKYHTERRVFALKKEQHLLNIFPRLFPLLKSKAKKVQLDEQTIPNPLLTGWFTKSVAKHLWHSNDVGRVEELGLSDVFPPKVH